MFRLHALCNIVLWTCLPRASRPNKRPETSSRSPLPKCSTMASTSVSPQPESIPGTKNGPNNRYAPTAVERQRMQLDRLLKDPSKPVNLPAAPKEKTIRPPREMMKNVQGSSAGAGSGEFHVYKAGRRREYERLKLMDEEAQQVCFDLVSS